MERLPVLSERKSAFSDASPRHRQEDSARSLRQKTQDLPGIVPLKKRSATPTPVATQSRTPVQIRAHSEASTLPRYLNRMEGLAHQELRASIANAQSLEGLTPAESAALTKLIHASAKGVMNEYEFCISLPCLDPRQPKPRRRHRHVVRALKDVDAKASRFRNTLNEKLKKSLEHLVNRYLVEKKTNKREAYTELIQDIDSLLTKYQEAFVRTIEAAHKSYQFGADYKKGLASKAKGAWFKQSEQKLIRRLYKRAKGFKIDPENLPWAHNIPTRPVPKRTLRQKARIRRAIENARRLDTAATRIQSKIRALHAKKVLSQLLASRLQTAAKTIQKHARGFQVRQAIAKHVERQMTAYTASEAIRQSLTTSEPQVNVADLLQYREALLAAGYGSTDALEFIHDQADHLDPVHPVDTIGDHEWNDDTHGIQYHLGNKADDNDWVWIRLSPYKAKAVASARKWNQRVASQAFQQYPASYRLTELQQLDAARQAENPNSPELIPGIRSVDLYPNYRFGLDYDEARDTMIDKEGNVEIFVNEKGRVDVTVRNPNFLKQRFEILPEVKDAAATQIQKIVRGAQGREAAMRAYAEQLGHAWSDSIAEQVIDSKNSRRTPSYSSNALIKYTQLQVYLNPDIGAATELIAGLDPDECDARVYFLETDRNSGIWEPTNGLLQVSKGEDEWVYLDIKVPEDTEYDSLDELKTILRRRCVGSQFGRVLSNDPNISVSEAEAKEILADIAAQKAARNAAKDAE